jgi:hypothetical protein
LALNKANQKFKQKISGLRKANKKHRKHKCLAKKKVKELSKLFEELKKKFQLSEDNMKRITSCLGEMGLGIFKHLKKNQDKNKYPRGNKKIHSYNVFIFTQGICIFEEILATTSSAYTDQVAKCY